MVLLNILVYPYVFTRIFELRSFMVLFNNLVYHYVFTRIFSLWSSMVLLRTGDMGIKSK